MSIRVTLPDDDDAPGSIEPGRPIIEVRDLAVGFGERLIMDGLALDVRRGEILGVVGASGTGKSVLLRTIIGLIRQRRGLVKVFGHNMATVSARRRRLIERRWGVLFQHGALFSSLTVKQNIQFPMREYLHLSEDLLEEMAMVKLRLVGLKPEAADRMPSELSGGMIKRVALARALALDPEIVFLDEPTSGLDPIGAQDFDELIATLQKTLGLTVFMVTHDLDSLAGICDRIAALGDGKVLYEGTLDELKKQPHPWLQAYFNGARARASHVHSRRSE
ncbi:MAG: putative ABC transport system ATP-binding [Beijerinckiaceae bacterium]|nr:MAG: putative ABC transport system ATP-binding [Beijerinckiaceae bacterium]